MNFWFYRGQKCSPRHFLFLLSLELNFLDVKWHSLVFSVFKPSIDWNFALHGLFASSIKWASSFCITQSWSFWFVLGNSVGNWKDSNRRGNGPWVLAQGLSSTCITSRHQVKQCDVKYKYESTSWRFWIIRSWKQLPWQLVQLATGLQRCHTLGKQQKNLMFTASVSLELRATEPKDMLLLQSVWQAHERRKIITVADRRLLLNYQPFPLADTPWKDEATNSAVHMHPCSSLFIHIMWPWIHQVVWLLKWMVLKLRRRRSRIFSIWVSYAAFQIRRSSQL